MTNEILNHLWQSTAFAALCAASTLVFRNNRAQVRYALWGAASAKFLVPFAALIAAGRIVGPRLLPTETSQTVSSVLEFVAQPIARTALPPATRVPALLERGSQMVPLMPALLASVWLLGTIALIVRWAIQRQRVAGVAKRATVMTDGREFEILRRLERERGGRRSVALLAADGSMEPGVFGLLSPRLLWPGGISRHLDDAQIEAIIAHELSHVGRFDNLSAAVHMGIQAAFWFHPMLWWIGARLVDERERACDEDVLRQGSMPEVYAESILRTCRYAIESPLACVAGVTGADLKRRIETIMSGRPVHAVGRAKQTVLAGALAAAVLMPLTLGIISAPRLHAQTDGLRVGEQKFEVASVKPNRAGEQNGSLRRQPGGRMTATNMPLRQLITFAYQLSPLTLVGGPSWIDESRFDIVARMEGDPPPVPVGGGPDPMMLAMRTLLAERFKLELHSETRQLDVYALVMARSNGSPGSALKPSTQDCSPEAIRAMLARAAAAGAPPPPLSGGLPQCGARMMPGQFTMGGMPLSVVTGPLGGMVGRIVVDRTGLTGNWDAELKFAADSGRGRPPGANPPPADPDAPSIFTAVQEQWGLKLESTKAPVAVLSIDKIEAPSPD